MKNVIGKTALITGGASGIGLGMAKAFANAGMKVIVADLRQDHLDEALAYFNQAGQTVHAICVDVADRTAMADMAREAESVFGPVQLLCNNAGINILRPLDEADYPDWDWLISVNLGGVVNSLVNFIPRMKAHGQGGHIVNTSSIAGVVGRSGDRRLFSHQVRHPRVVRIPAL